MNTNNSIDSHAHRSRERKGLMLCCMRTAERYGDLHRDIPKGTTIQCNKCEQDIESLGGQAWQAK